MKFYRYEAREYTSMNEESPKFYPNPQLELIELNLFKETKKGWWIGYGWQNPTKLRSEAKWVSKTARKRYAYPTKEEALVNYIKRTERRIRILKYQLSSCEISLGIAGRKLDSIKAVKI